MSTELISAAVITGGSRGIGFAVAKRLAAGGRAVFLLDRVPLEDIEASCATLTAQGGTALACSLDITDSGAVADFFKERIKDKFNLDVLVNNAGITKDNLILRMKDQDFDAVLAVNLKGAFICLREAAKIMIRQESGGSIVNIASVAGLMGNAGQANYAASKAGLIGLTKTAALELASRLVRVNAVAPGFIGTDMTAKLPNEVREGILRHIPLKRIGAPEEIAAVVEFLCSDQAAYITGQVLSVDGGLYM